MKNLALDGLSICATAALLAACGGSQPPIGWPGSVPQGDAIAAHAERGGSWIVRNTAGQDLTDAISAHRSAYRQLFVFGTPSGKCPDGANPYGNLVAVNGLFYGTTFGGGANGGGTIFTVTKRGLENVLYSFSDHNKYGGFGGGPKAGLVAINRTLYGTTPVNGYYYDGGMVFAIGTSGKQERVLHSFGPKGDGDSPRANVIDAGDTLYGTTFQGGAYGNGSVFGVNPKTGARYHRCGRHEELRHDLQSNAVRQRTRTVQLHELSGRRKSAGRSDQRQRNALWHDRTRRRF